MNTLPPKRIVTIPKGGLQARSPATPPGMPASHTKLQRAAYITAAVLWIGFLTIETVRLHSYEPVFFDWGLYILWRAIATPLIALFAIGIASKMRPGTGTFWKIMAICGLAFIIPHLAITPLAFWIVLKTTIVAMILLCVYYHEVWRAETWGWRLVAFGGMVFFLGGLFAYTAGNVF